MLALESLSVAIGPAVVLADVSLEVQAGRIVGLVGPNGAGKTTLLDAVSGLARATSGTVRLSGTDITRLAPHRRARLGLARTFQALDLFDDLDAEENVLVRLNHRIGGTRLQEPVRGLSHGERKAIALDRALAAHPRVLLLDEPAAGLDAAARRALMTRLRDLAASGVALVLADHDIDLVMDVSDEVC
ncbi:MAG: ATP-binding cassette domain-containing protein, partial [Acidimicrobiales bacterium]